jgi:hypothetical protein
MDTSSKKQFPEEFTQDVIDIVEAMSFNKMKGVELLGSMSMKVQLYTVDHDLYQTVQMGETSDDKAVAKLVAEFKAIIRELMKKKNVYIGDIKCGSVSDWEVISPDAKIDKGKVVGYDHLKAVEKLKKLFQNNLITKDEYKESERLLVTKPTPTQFLEMKNNIKFNIVRWAPKDVLNGYVQLKGNVKYTLEEGFTCKALTKMDVVAFVSNHYSDFSMIYDFYNKKKLLNGKDVDVKNGLKSDILYYESQGQYYKVAKRMFSFVKDQNNKPLMDKILPILNDSQFGLLYVVCGDITVLLWILENESHVPTEKFNYEIDQFKTKLANVYKPHEFEEERGDIFGIINKLIHKMSGTKGKGEKVHALEELLEKLTSILNNSTKLALKKAGLLPVPTIFKP